MSPRQTLAADLLAAAFPLVKISLEGGLTRGRRSALR
jgi:hypothetical protein